MQQLTTAFATRSMDKQYLSILVKTNIKTIYIFQTLDMVVPYVNEINKV